MKFQDLINEAKGPQKVKAVLSNLKKKYKDNSFLLTPNYEDSKISVFTSFNVFNDGNKTFVPFLAVEDSDGSIDFVGLRKKGNQSFIVDRDYVTDKAGAKKFIKSSKPAAIINIGPRYDDDDKDDESFYNPMMDGRKKVEANWDTWLKNIEPKLSSDLGMV